MMDRAPYVEKFLFDVPQGGTADCDEAIIGDAMLDQMKEKMKDVLAGGEHRH